MSNNDWREKISMMLDGELPPEEVTELMNRIGEDQELQQVWHRYQISSHLLKQNTEAIASSGFSESVRNAISEEPTVLAPIKKAGRKIHKQAATVVAASFVLFAVVIGNFPDNSPVSDRAPQVVAVQPPVEVAQPKLALVEAQKPEIEVTKVAEVTPVVHDGEVWIEDEELNDYLMKHSEKSHSRGAYGVLPFARVVSYGNAR